MVSRVMFHGSDTCRIYGKLNGFGQTNNREII